MVGRMIRDFDDCTLRGLPPRLLLLVAVLLYGIFLLSERA